MTNNQGFPDRVPLDGTIIRRDPLREQVRSQIRQLSLTNRLRPGQTIVTERMARELGVSLTPVREALAILQHDGLVRMKPFGTPWETEIEPTCMP